MICFKDLQPTWNILGFDEGLDFIPTTTLPGYGNDPLDTDTAICFSFPEKNEYIYYYPQTDITISSRELCKRGNTLEKLFKSRESHIYVYSCSSNMFVKTYIMPYVIDDHLVYRKLQITIVCGMNGMNYKCRMLPFTEVNRYVFYENGVVIENRDGSRAFTTPGKLMDDSLKTVFSVTPQYDPAEIFRAFCKKVHISYKKQIVELLKNFKPTIPGKTKPVLSFDKFIGMYTYATETKEQFEGIPDRIIYDLKNREYNDGASVRLYKDLILITCTKKNKEFGCEENVRIYADKSNSYYFKQNIVSGMWKRAESILDVFDYDSYGRDINLRFIDKTLFYNTCVGRYAKNSIVPIFPTKSKADLFRTFIQKEYLAVEQAVKISEGLFNNILYTIHKEGTIDRTKKLSDLLGITGAQIKFLTEYDHKYMGWYSERLNLVRFGKLMRSEKFISHFPDVKKRIFVVMMCVECEESSRNDTQRIDDELLFEGAQTIGGIVNTSIGRRERLCEEYLDYLRMRTILNNFLSNLDKADPLYPELEKFSDMPVNMKPSKIFDYHQDISKALSLIRSKELIIEYSPSIINQKKTEAKYIEYSNGEYSIVMPNDAADIIREGRELRHCVGSAGYIERMANNKCRILFLRENAELSKPLITIEERDGCIKQCYGYRDSFNHNEKIRDFLTEYAKSRGLNVTAVTYKPV